MIFICRLKNPPQQQKKRRKSLKCSSSCRLASFTPRQPSHAGSKGKTEARPAASRRQATNHAEANAETPQANDGEPALVLHGRRVVAARLEACWAPVDSMAVSRQYGFAVESGHRISHWPRAIVGLRVVERGSHEPGGAFGGQRSEKYKAEERKKRCQAQRSGRRFRSSCCSRELKRQLLLAWCLAQLVHCNFSFSPRSQELRPAAKNLQGCGPCILHQRRVLVNGNNSIPRM